MSLRLPAGVVIIRDANNGANIIGHLEKPACARIGVSIVSYIFSESKVKGIAQRYTNCPLSIIVVNGNYIEQLKIRQAIKNEQGEITPNPRLEFLSIAGVRNAIPQNKERKWKLTNEPSELSKQSLPIPRRHRRIILVAMQQIFSMERYIGKPRNRKPTFIAVDWISDIGRMVVENDRNNIAPLREILAT